VSPHLNNLAAGRRRRLPNPHIKADGDRDKRGRDQAGQGHMTAPLGELFTPSGIVNLFGRFLME
jgi:hypothetical protein